ncbi:pre-mRNA-processing factor 39 isoform X2 [Copidosoma floridanum]|uniref:pre-mRNA-processing factor 39 isoform X2 n=1 Tax=Copidosoma floridanum TaxID=29053 RepID=UPI0006C9877F|nr:pre-mRNA-processing factor 39 isoform X2 [Copidosoma floridanum]
MSSLSGDENSETMQSEPVRRTRSGRAVKKVATTPVKKTPAKKTMTRATRASKIIHEVEEENRSAETDISTPENGVQTEVIKDLKESTVEKLQSIKTPEQTDDKHKEQVVEHEEENQNNEHLVSKIKTSQEPVVAYQQEQGDSSEEEQSETCAQKQDNVHESEESEEQEEQEQLNTCDEEQENINEQLQENMCEEQQEVLCEEETESMYEQEIESGTYELVQENIYEEEQENICADEQENTCEDEQENTFVMEQENSGEEDQENLSEQVQESTCEEEQVELQEELMEECQAEAATVEGEEILEFDPEAGQPEEEAAAQVPEQKPDEEPEAEPMAVDEEVLAESLETAETAKRSLRIKAVSEMMEESTDDQCILIEDDVDQFVMEEEEKAEKEKQDLEKKKFSGQDSEIIPDNDQFRNEDVEFISECNEVSENSIQQSNQDHEVIEISDHESEPTSKKNEIDTEAVSEDELPTETAAKEPETEAVSDEELPVVKPADLGETESVSDEELPVESDRKKKGSKSASKSNGKKSKSESSKRKRNAEVDASNDKADVKPPSPKKKTLPELEKYWKAVNDDPADFTGWTYLLQYVDQENDAEAAREAYSKFLERYPYCYGYWRKYADYEKKKGDPERVQTVFDQGLKAISLSVDLWLHYINHCKVAHEKDEEKMREQYNRAINACGLEFRSDKLWLSYLEWEKENKKLDKVMAIYDRLLCTPTLGYLSHFESFQDFVTTNSPNKILSVDGFLTLRAEVKASLKADDSAGDDAPPGEETDKDAPPSDEETRAIREKIISTRRKMHKSNVNAVAARWTFEEGIKRPYFHVKPLERCQLKNWKEYLDYEIEQKDQDRVIILFERCLVACALYDEFWMRFVRYLESLKGDNTDKIQDVYTRACKVHHPKKPNLHLQWATFEESLGHYDKAASILENIDDVIPNMLQIAYRRINLERRRGDLDKTCSLYEHYINNSKNRTISNNIVVKYARFLCKIKNDTDKAVKVLLRATEKDKDNPRLYLQLIDLGLQRNPINTQEVIGYMDLFIDREHADAEQRVLFAQRKVEFLEDFSTDIRQVLKAHEQFQKCIKQAKERKKTKNDDSKTDVAAKKAKLDTSSVPPPTVGSQSYQYGATAYQSQQQFPSGQYGTQGGYQQSYQQYPAPSDPNYANYQNWQYSQSGPQAYNPYNQWGSYNYY